MSEKLPIISTQSASETSMDNSYLVPSNSGIETWNKTLF